MAHDKFSKFKKDWIIFKECSQPFQNYAFFYTEKGINHVFLFHYFHLNSEQLLTRLRQELANSYIDFILLHIYDFSKLGM